MRKTFLYLLLMAALLSGCIPSQTAAAPTAEDGSTAAPPTPAAEPTTVPTALATSTLISPLTANALESMLVGDVDPTGQLVWAADGQSIAVQSFNSITIYRLDPITAEHSLSIPEGSGVMGLVSPEMLAAVAQGQNDASVFNAASGEQVGTVHSDSIFVGGSLSPDGTRLALASDETWRADLYDVASGSLTGSLSGFETAAPVYNIRFSPSGKSLVWFARGTIQLMDIASQKLGPRLEHEDFISAFDVSLDDSRLATAAGATINGASTTAVILWNPASGEKLGTAATADTVSSLSFSPDGTLLAADNGSAVTLWDTSNMSEVATLNSTGGLMVAAAFAPNGRTLATLSDDGKLMVWHVNDCNVCTIPPVSQ